jgi:dienelactone hydrolase
MTLEPGKTLVEPWQVLLAQVAVPRCLCSAISCTEPLAAQALLLISASRPNTKAKALGLGLETILLVPQNDRFMSWPSVPFCASQLLRDCAKVQSYVQKKLRRSMRFPAIAAAIATLKTRVADSARDLSMRLLPRLRISLIAAHSAILIALHSTRLQAQPALTEAFAYQSGALSIQAQQCWPDPTRFPAPHPLLLFNHGGVAGINTLVRRRMRELCDLGYRTAASSYRGEDGSDGQIEVALGEVDDVLAMYQFLASDLSIDTGRLGMLGFSHGALIGLQALKRRRSEFPVRAFVFAYGVADIAIWYRHLQRTGQLGQDALSQTVFGRGPQLDPERFALRDGLRGLSGVPLTSAVLIVQGQRDRIVPPEQADLLYSALQQQGARVLLHQGKRVGHGFLIQREAQRGQAKAESDAAWAAIYQFLQAELAPKASPAALD